MAIQTHSFQAAHQLVLTDPQGLTTWVSAGFTEHTGYSLGDMLGRTPGSLLQRADAQPEAVMDMSTAIREGRPCHGVEILNYRKDGSPFTVQLDIEPRFDSQGVLNGFASVQTCLSAAIERRQESARRHRQLLLGVDLCGVSLAHQNLADRRFSPNDNFRRMFGLPAEGEVCVEDAMARIHADDLPMVQAMQQRAREGDCDGSDMKFRIVHDGGQIHHVLCRRHLVCDAAGLPVELFSALVCITEQVQAEESLLRAQQQLRDLAVHQREQFDQLRAELSRDLHDELGQTLGAIKCEVDMIESLDIEIAQRLRVLVGEGVSSVRAVSRALRSPTLDLGLGPALRTLANETSMRGDVDIDVQMADGLPPLAEHTTRTIYRIVQAALTNVVHHAAASHVSISLRECGERITLEVLDDGRGFETASLLDGPGLGLAGMRERAKQLGADFSVGSRPHEGTFIRVDFPHLSAGGGA